MTTFLWYTMLYLACAGAGVACALLYDNPRHRLWCAIAFGVGTLLAPSPARGADDWGTERWTTGDTVRQGALVTLQVVDWRQTRWFLKHNGRYVDGDGAVTSQHYRERNPILGPYPSVGKVNNLIGASIVGHALVSAALPRAWREPWQYVWLGAEVYSVIGNYRLLGVRAVF